MEVLRLDKLKKKNRLPTGAVIAIGFILIIAAGSLLLFLPFANRFPAHGLKEYFDCVFTAASCVCVTGLSTVQVHDTFTVFGQAVMLLMIQIGGLGFMTMALLLARMIKRRITPKEQMVAAQACGFDSNDNVRTLVYGIIRRAMVIEGIGTVLLMCRMWKYTSGFLQALWYSLFHSVSAFCNAGFDLFNFEKGSLTGLAEDSYILIVLMLLIYVGGIGFMVWDDVLHRIRDKTDKLSVYTRFVLLFSVLLFAVSFVFTFVFEYDNPQTLGRMPLINKIVNAAFHSVSLRTAGFAAIPGNMLNDATKLLSCLMMFIGGCSGSTAGGIKVGTVGLILFAVARFSFGKKNLNISGRSIDTNTVIRAFSLFFIGLLTILVFTGIFSAVEDHPVIDLLYETASAFGTVGLSVGVTPILSYFTKCLLILLMYFGRVGVLTVTSSFTSKSGENDGGIRYPAATFYIG